MIYEDLDLATRSALYLAALAVLSQSNYEPKATRAYAEVLSMSAYPGEAIELARAIESELMAARSSLVAIDAENLHHNFQPETVRLAMELNSLHLTDGMWTNSRPGAAKPETILVLEASILDDWYSS